MKSINSFFRNLAVLLVSTSLVVLFTGCDHKSAEAPGHPSHGKSEAPALLASAEKNSFKEVTSQLDAGGDFYVYLSLERWLEGLSATVAEWRETALTMPNLGPTDQANLNQAFDVVSRLIKNSGVEGISGFGASSIALEKGYYQGKVLLHHYPGKPEGYLWTLFGATPHALTGLNLLPTDTALASFLDLDLNGLWSALQKETSQPNLAEVSAGLRKFAESFEQGTGLKWEQLLASLGGEFGFFLTLNETNKVTVPLPTGSSLEIPEPGLVVVIKVKDDTLFNRLDQELKNNPQVTSSEKDGVRLRTMALDLPLPMKLSPTIARTGDLLLLALTDTLMQEVLELHSGKGTGLKATAEFKKLVQGMPTEGNNYGYVSQLFGKTMGQIQQSFISANMNAQGTEKLMQKLMDLNPPVNSFAVAANTQQGWFFASHGGQDLSKAILVPAVAMVGVPAAMLIPSLNSAKTKAQSISCINNLKQIGLAARIYAVDHDDTLPPDFFAMKNELATPKVLVCPLDTSRPKPENFTWEEFKAEMISYEYLAPGIKDSGDPQKVVFRCPIHGHVGLLDGSVQQKRGSD